MRCTTRTPRTSVPRSKPTLSPEAESGEDVGAGAAGTRSSTNGIPVTLPLGLRGHAG